MLFSRAWDRFGLLNRLALTTEETPPRLVIRLVNIIKVMGTQVTVMALTQSLASPLKLLKVARKANLGRAKKAPSAILLAYKVETREKLSITSVGILVIALTIARTVVIIQLVRTL